jgi:hypothetical protein
MLEWYELKPEIFKAKPVYNLPRPDNFLDGHRTIGFVISPYTKRNVLISQYFTQLDFTRTIEQILGLPPMTQLDMAIDPLTMKDVFTETPDSTPYKALKNNIPIDELNPPISALKGIEKEWAIAMQKEDFSHPDAANELLLNRVIWYSVKNFKIPYPGDERVLRPDEVMSYLQSKGLSIDEDDH